mgnify:CR=1 FL=1
MVTKLHKSTYDKQYSNMVDYLDTMDSVPFFAVAPTGPMYRVLAALGPKMLELSNVLRRMVERNGHESTLKRVRTACVCTAIFGVSLATGIVNPIKWE